jgi:abortive infection bacteriophage resistance protein
MRNLRISQKQKDEMMKRNSSFYRNEIDRWAKAIDKTLTDNKLTAEVQIADVELACWGIVENASFLRAAIFDELSDLEGDDHT